VLAPSFARIFYRNAIDGGHLLPIEVTADTVKKISNGDQLEITLSTNKIRNRTKNEEYEMRPLQDLIAKIVEAGGLLNYRRV
jgi:3-isopropylmalate/(R)-2-methylmalate dehydratase small subunit